MLRIYIYIDTHAHCQESAVPTAPRVQVCMQDSHLEPKAGRWEACLIRLRKLLEIHMDPSSKDRRTAELKA